MIYIYSSNLKDLHNPNFVYQIEGRSPQKYPEVGKRLDINYKKTWNSNIDFIEIVEIKPNASKLIMKTIDYDYWMWLNEKIMWLKQNSFDIYLDEEKLFIKDQITPVTMDLKQILEYVISMVMEAIEQVVENNERRIYVACRPPGHHASKSYGGGFCYLNNVGIAIEYLMSKVDKYNKICVLDLDLHIGNGTIDYLKDMLEIQYFSLHLNPCLCYPFFTKEKIDELKLRNNICLYQFEKGITEQIYLQMIEKILNDVESYSPDILFISMGYDTYKYDPCYGCGLNVNTYKKISKNISSRFDIPIIIFHEGGYEIGSCEEMLNSFVCGII